ncbi:MAG: hypothetical protein GWN58_16090, partial [Anaerolineae bacterium]|nr:hypothetical protein [Anaerolineae bacterium]
MQKIREVASRFALLAVLCATNSAWAQSSTLTRVSSFEYDEEGALITETVEPDRPDDCLRTTYALDTFGNQVSSSVSACAGASGHSV